MENTLGTRDRIVRAGRDLFAERGYAAIGVDDLVAAAGATRSAVYEHFEDKREVFRAVFEIVEQDLAEKVARGAAAETDPWEQMRAGMRAYLEACCDLAVRRIVLIDGPSVLGWEEWRRIDSRFAFAMVRAALEANVAAGNLAEPSLDALTHLYVGSLNEAGLAVAASNDRAARIEEFMATLDRIINAQRVGRTAARDGSAP
jgi:AcrR family transcriptional regulator